LKNQAKLAASKAEAAAAAAPRVKAPGWLYLALIAKYCSTQFQYILMVIVVCSNLQLQSIKIKHANKHLVGVSRVSAVAGTEKFEEEVGDFCSKNVQLYNFKLLIDFVTHNTLTRLILR
jgi:hypothetical protein